MGVISDPAYVVGMQMCGRPVRMLIAFPSPMVDPPPIEMTASALTDFAYSRAFSVMCEGVCMVASVKIPATLPSRRVLRCVAWSTCCGVERRRGAETFNRATSADSLERVPLPKMTRAGAALYSNASMVLCMLFGFLQLRLIEGEGLCSKVISEVGWVGGLSS